MARSSRLTLVMFAALSSFIVLGCGGTESSVEIDAGSTGSGGSVGSGGSSVLNGTGGSTSLGSGGQTGSGGIFVEPPPASGGTSGTDAAADASDDASAPTPDAGPMLAVCKAGMACKGNTMCMETCPGAADLICMCTKGKVACVGKCPPPPKMPPPPKPAPKCANTVKNGGACKTGAPKCRMNAQTCTCTAMVWTCQ
jgi:hypothetical protein